MVVALELDGEVTSSDVFSSHSHALVAVTCKLDGVCEHSIPPPMMPL